MTDLSDWGGGIDHSGAGTDDGIEGPEHDDGRASEDGRCRALLPSGQRCRNDTTDPVGEDGLCPSHDQVPDVITIDDDPAYLIGVTAGDVWPNPADEIDDWDEITTALQEVSIFEWEV